jgi:predicted PurR-regulated permease PerM
MPNRPSSSDRPEASGPCRSPEAPSAAPAGDSPEDAANDPPDDPPAEAANHAADEAADEAADTASSVSADAPNADAGTARFEGLTGSLTAFDAVLIAGGFVLFLVLLYEMEVPPREGSFLNPPLVAAAGAVLLWPLRGHRAVRALMLSGGTLLLLWMMNAVSNILIPFVGVYLLAYLLNPVVKGLRIRRGVPRWASSLAITAVVVGSFALFLLILAPSLAAQIEALSERLIEALGGLRTWLASSPALGALEQAGLLDKQEVIGQMQAILQRQARQLPDTAERVAASIGSLFGVVTLLALVPLLLFYTLKDYERIRDALIELFPTAGGRRDYLIDAGSIVGRYLRGQLIISLIATFNVSVFLFLFDVPFWLLIGLVAGVLNFVPNLGAIISLLIGGFVALVFGGWLKALIVALVLLGQGLLEQSLLTPNILSYQVGLHPVLVVFSLLVFGSFLGVFGLLIAVPATAILVTAYRAYREELTLELGDYTAGNGL